MAMRSNQTEQMAKRLAQDLQLLAPELAVARISTASQEELAISLAGNQIALIRLNRRSFDGFNIVAELDASVGNGFPEHECWLAIKAGTALAEVAKLVKAAAHAGASELKVISTAAAPQESDLVDANVVAAIPNDARMGAVGL